MEEYKDFNGRLYCLALIQPNYEPLPRLKHILEGDYKDYLKEKAKRLVKNGDIEAYAEIFGEGNKRKPVLPLYAFNSYYPLYVEEGKLRHYNRKWDLNIGQGDDDKKAKIKRIGKYLEVKLPLETLYFLEI